MAPLPALIYGIVLSVISVIAMDVLTNWVAAGMLTTLAAHHLSARGTLSILSSSSSHSRLKMSYISVREALV